MKLDRNISIMLLLAGLSLVMISCSSDEPAGNDARVVASVGDRELTLADLKDYLDSRQLDGRTPVSRDRLTQLLDEMILAETLYQEALQLELDQDPEIRRAMQQTLNQRLLQRTITEPVLSRQIGDEELQSYFEQHRWEYAWPEQMRVADIFIAVPAGAISDEKDAKKKQAERLLAEARQQQRERFGFSRLIKQHSDKHPKYALGDTGFFDRHGQPVGIDPGLAQIAFALEKNGELYPLLVETPQGYHIIMRVGSRAALEKTHEDVASALQQRIRSEELRSKQQDYIEALRKRVDVRIETDAIDSLAQELKSAVAAKSLDVKAGTPAGRGSLPPPLPGSEP